MTEKSISVPACTRCEEHPAFGPTNLCIGCSATYNRLKRTTYDRDEAFTTAIFVANHPVRPSRRIAKILGKPEKSSSAQPVNWATQNRGMGNNTTSISPTAFETALELIPGFAICGEVTESLAKQIRQFAATEYPICIFGETGTGKELVVKALHQLGPRKGKPLIIINCASLNGDLANSELFGHKKGSFTGSVQAEDGLFIKADGGTIVFDELEELPHAAQVNLLRTLNDGEVRPVGSTTTRTVDVRVIALTKTPFAQLKSSNFREDLLYRLADLSIHISPLRERSAEIIPLTHYLLQQINKRSYVIENNTATSLVRHEWRGNVRELRSVLRRATVVAEGNLIASEHLPETFRTRLTAVK
ncbi:MAG: sigma-54-dependent Fis family transcriptional regulator [Parcubacteria group bacterium]|nr:sigma-54-dependent Fis family transcriptional regulator [Parcubacteria group bacterium]